MPETVANWFSPVFALYTSEAPDELPIINAYWDAPLLLPHWKVTVLLVKVELGTGEIMVAGAVEAGWTVTEQLAEFVPFCESVIPMVAL